MAIFFRRIGIFPQKSNNLFELYALIAAFIIHKILETTDKTLFITESPLKTYIQYLLENNMEALEAEDRDIIEEVEHFFFENLGPESKDRKITTITTIKDFLGNVITDNTINDVKQNLISLVKIKLLEVYNMEVLLSGIRLLYRLRKESIFEHLSHIQVPFKML